MEANVGSLSGRNLCGWFDLIFVMLGTSHYPFARLINKVIEWAEESGEHVIIQSGHNPIASNAVEFYPFLDHSKIIEFINDAEVVITQGGFGGLLDCMKSDAKTIAIPRLAELGENINSHQTEIVNALAEEGRIVPLHDIDKFDDAIQSAKHMNIKTNNNCALPEHVKKTINGFLEK